MFKFPFAPGAAGQNATAAAATPASVSLNTKCDSVRIVNTGTTNPVSVKFGTGAQTAAATDTVVRANSEIILYKGTADTLSYFSTAGTTLQIQEGTGGV